jgi:predicted AlkP superfamily pyrophosphatase or phosphodiesterase
MLRRNFLLSLAATLAAPAQNRQRHVLIVSVDGFAAYALRDPMLPVPTVRRLAAQGAIASGMETVNPTVTWPNHTTMVTGVRPAKHEVLYNGLAIRGQSGEPLRVEPWIDKPQLVKAPTLYDAVHAAGMSTAEVDWVAIHNAKTITYAFPEVPRMTDPVVNEMIAAGKLRADQVQGSSKASIVWRDEMWTLAGQHIVETHKPNLLLFHLLTTDSAQHRYGAGSLAGYAALELADAKIGRLLASYERAGIAGRTAVFIVSDHGFKTFRKLIHPNALLRQKGLLRDAPGRIECDAWVIPEGGSAMVYVTVDGKRAELLAKLREWFAAVEGVERVVEADSFEALGYPPRPGDQMSDLVLAAKDGYAFDGVHQGEIVTNVPAGATPGAHGYLSTEADMDAVFVASGAGVKRGVTLGRVRNIDVAPTAARILGVEMKGVDGRVLSEILA